MVVDRLKKNDIYDYCISSNKCPLRLFNFEGAYQRVFVSKRRHFFQNKKNNSYEISKHCIVFFPNSNINYHHDYLLFSLLLCLYTNSVHILILLRGEHHQISNQHCFAKCCACQREALHSTQKMKFFIKDFFSKYDQIRSFLWIWSHLLKKS